MGPSASLMGASFPWPVISPQGLLLAFGDLAQFGSPWGFDGKALRVSDALVYRLAPDTGDLRHIGRASLPPLDLEAAHFDTQQFRQQLQRVQAGRFFHCVVGFTFHLETSLAQGGIAGILI